MLYRAICKLEETFMKISSFNPLIVSSKGEELISLFEELGFEKQHTVEQVTESGVVNVDMKDAQGNQIDIALTKNVDRDLTLIRINVENFEEAFDFLTSRGFINMGGESRVESEHAKSAMMISPSGFAFNLCQHKK